jgi:trans-aconitate methyltransferase
LQNHTGNRGTGNLAKRFKNQQDYTGLEYSQSMIAIAQKRNENCTFILGIWDFNLEKQVDAIIITGRSTSYLTTK